MMKRVIIKMRKMIMSISNYKSTRMAIALMRMNKKMRRKRKNTKKMRRKKKSRKKKRTKKKRRKNKRKKMSLIMRVTM